ncbi:MAG: patatin-like phospholipase family protein, partial [Myxococcota bacterium]|nr:patatin-like phospholipase family protein [Myxococcota bacterium]MDW8362312.1 patatin-like phospholipase family protein [Myxococcales bacterium]
MTGACAPHTLTDEARRRASVRVEASNRRRGLVLSGGGARGAYEVGVLAGLVEALGLRPTDRPPFRIFCGTSVGAINAAYLAAHADRGDLNVDGLVAHWSSLSLGEHLRLDPLGLFGVHPRRSGWFGRRKEAELWGRSLLDPRPLDALVRRAVPWDRLHAHVATGLVDAFVVTALHVGTGRTHLFAEL